MSNGSRSSCENSRSLTNLAFPQFQEFTGEFPWQWRDFKQKTVQQMIARRITNLEDPDA